MVTYPISVRRKYYQGSSAKKQFEAQEHNRIAAVLEEHINKRMMENQATEFFTYTYGRIAADLGLDLELVRNILFSVDYGHNGLTIRKPQLAP